MSSISLSPVGEIMMMNSEIVFFLLNANPGTQHTRISSVRAGNQVSNSGNGAVAKI